MDRKHQEEAALANWGGRPDTSDHGDEQKPQTIASDSDMIAVPRSLLGAAAYCVRKHVGTDSETYKALSALTMSPPLATVEDAYETWIKTIPGEFNRPHISEAFAAGYAASQQSAESGER